MKGSYIKQLARYGVFFVISLFIIFFLGTETVDNKTQRTIKADAVKDFRLGMDIAWGMRLTYKLDFSEYEQVYTNASELETFKKSTVAIVKKNMSNRVNKLGVSDTRVVDKTLDWEKYLIVELGWVTNEQAAKDTIGKTVELQFKMPAPEDVQLIQERKDKISSVVQDAKQNNTPLEQLQKDLNLADSYYQSITQQSLDDLALIYDANRDAIANLQKWDIAIYEGLYDVWMSEAAWSPQALSGTTIVKLIDVTSNTLPSISAQRVLDIANDNQLETTRIYEFANYWVESGSIVLYDETTAIHNAGEMFAGQEAYQLSLYSIAKQSLIGADPATQQQAQAEIDTKKQNLISQLESGELPTAWSGIARLFVEQRQDISSLQKTIAGFESTEPGIQTFETETTSYIANITQKKLADQPLYIITKVSGVNATSFPTLQNSMKTEVLYSFEEVFVRDRPIRISAIDPQTKQILNAAFFKYANIATSPTWEPVVIINFDDTWKEIFCRISEKLIGQPIAIFIWEDPLPITAPIINERICGWQAQISWWFTLQDARVLVDDLNEWAFPVALIPAWEERMSPVLGINALTWAMIAWGVWLVVIIIFLFFMYGTKKAIVWGTVLIVYITYLLAVLKLPFINYAFSLSGIAAIILALWMWVDANILIFERVREELKSWKKIGAAINAWVARSRAPIKDWNISTWLIAALLFLVWTSIFKWFGGMIIITMLLVLLINVPLTQLILHLVFSSKSSFQKK